MRFEALLSVPLAFLFLGSVLPSNAQSADDAGATVVYYEVRGNLTLSCAGLVNDNSVALVWKKNNTLVEDIPELKDRYKLVEAGGVARAEFVIARRALEADHGDYSCGAGAAARAFSVRARTHAKLPLNTNVVEEQTLKITCKLVGQPYMGVVWTYSNTSESVDNGSLEVREALGERAALQPSDQGVPDAVLVVKDAQRSDAGWYKCTPVAGAPGAETPGAVTTLRVKDKYAALWPFLGICAEVFVLCAVILVYERRRTKPELDDSDTDTRDQKKS